MKNYFNTFDTVKRGYSGHFLFYFYFELKDIFEQSKYPQLLVTYPRRFKKLLHPNNINNNLIKNNFQNYEKRCLKNFIFYMLIVKLP
jgi:hypothetical protein